MMLVRYHKPFSTIETLQRQFDQLFEDLTTNPFSEGTPKPAIELAEDEQAVILKVQLPGIDPKDLDIQVTREAVSMTGEYRAPAKQKDQGFYHSEFHYGKFQRVIPLPAEVQNDKVEAEYKNGILTLTLPKTIAAQNKVVKVTLASTPEVSA